MSCRRRARSHPKNPYIIKYATLTYVLIRKDKRKVRLTQGNKDTVRAIAFMTA
ncbi:MAG: hypothetical protein V7L02_23595 [Nostoc sp.]|uniref:hypothetical protein n=1 Tax=Nostoc sp. TaxID=1180 RepID=UPI002FFB8DBB